MFEHSTDSEMAIIKWLVKNRLARNVKDIPVFPPAKTKRIVNRSLWMEYDKDSKIVKLLNKPKDPRKGTEIGKLFAIPEMAETVNDYLFSLYWKTDCSYSKGLMREKVNRWLASKKKHPLVQSNYGGDTFDTIKRLVKRFKKVEEL